MDDKGQRDYIGIETVYGELKEIRQDIAKLKEVMNNGVIVRSLENTKAIKDLEKKIVLLHKCVTSGKIKEDTKKEVIKTFLKRVGIFTGGVVTSLTIVYYLLQIGLIGG